MDRFIQFAVAAAGQALEQRQLHGDAGERARHRRADRLRHRRHPDHRRADLRVLDQKGPRRVNPFTIPMMLTDLAAGRIAMQFGMTGPNFAVMSACASSANAIGEGAEIIRRGDATAMLCGGARGDDPALRRSPPSASWARFRRATTSRNAPAAHSTRTARASCWARARRCCCWKSATARWSAGRPSWPN